MKCAAMFALLLGISVWAEDGRIAAAEKKLAAAHALANTEFDAWADKLPEGPNVLEPTGALDTSATAKLHNNPVRVDGRSGKAWLFTGENGVRLPAIGQFTRGEAFTVSLWLRMAEATERAVVFHSGYELLLEKGRVVFGCGDFAKAVAKPLTLGRWTHIAVCYDGSSEAAGMRVFIDGVAQPAAVGARRSVAASGELMLGFRPGDVGFQGGMVEDFRIFARELAPVEIAALAGRDDFTKAVQSITELTPAQRTALLEYYIATAHYPSREARAELAAARKVIER